MARAAVATAAVAGNAALYEYFRQAWWSGPRARHLWINWETHEPFREQDKFGHAWGGYHLTRVGAGLLRSVCVSDRKSELWGAAYAGLFQLQIELWDGTQQEYGFSPPDLAADVTGAIFAVEQSRHPTLQALKPTISWASTAAYRNRAAHGGNPRATVDYSGQTYWVSVDMKQLLPDDVADYWPGIVRLSVGHSITDYVDPATGAGEWAHRKFVVSLDLDPSRLPGDFPVWRTVKRELSYYHFPAPALVLTPTLRGVKWYR